jgi:hypothetical protein
MFATVKAGKTEKYFSIGVQHVSGMAVHRFWLHEIDYPTFPCPGMYRLNGCIVQAKSYTGFNPKMGK